MGRSVIRCGARFTKSSGTDLFLGAFCKHLPVSHGFSKLIHRGRITADLNPSPPGLLTFLSLWCHLKKKSNAIGPPSLPPSPPFPSLPPSLHLMLSLFLRRLIPSLSGRPNQITSAARSTDSFLSTPALSGCSAGVF